MICDSPFYVLPSPAATEKVPVPCGRCPNCKLRRVNGWVFRCLKEAERSTSSLFVTLTYDVDRVPMSPNGFMTLRKSDFQDFMKRLRKLCPDFTLKYYACGEYGTERKRPHYHAIIFNVPDVAMIDQAWTLDGKLIGITQSGTVTGDSIAYTMKYIDKPTSKSMHARDDRAPEFALMSKGLGSNYLTDDMIAFHKADLSRMYLTKPGGHTIAMPRYFRDKIFTDDEKGLQTKLAQLAADTKHASDLKLYYDTYGYDNSYTFEQWMSSRRYGRHNLFYRNQNLRND